MNGLNSLDDLDVWPLFPEKVAMVPRVDIVIAVDTTENLPHDMIIEEDFYEDVSPKRLSDVPRRR